MNVAEIVDQIDSELIIRLTKKLVSMDSQNPPGKCNHHAKFLAEECKKFGFETKIYPLDDNRHNITVSFGEGERDIVLSGHLDTVPIGDSSNWKYPPLKATEENGRLYGRGTVDMLGGVATLIGVMELLHRMDIKFNHRIVFVGTADEEVGMLGAFHLQEKGIMDAADCLIITEATALKIGIAEKGPYWIRLYVKGKSAHGSMPDVGINAIEGACIAIKYLKEIIPVVEHDLLGRTTVNIGSIKGGEKINIVADECYIDCDFRLIPSVNRKEFDLEIEKLMVRLSEEYPCTYFHEVLHAVPALSTKPDNLIIQNLLKWSNKIAKHPPEPIGLAYATDAAALIPPRDIPFAIIGGGSPSLLHQDNEYVEIAELIAAAKIIAGAIIDTYGKEK